MSRSSPALKSAETRSPPWALFWPGGAGLPLSFCGTILNSFPSNTSVAVLPRMTSPSCVSLHIVAEITT